jgi:hypothetical protein
MQVFDNPLDDKDCYPNIDAFMRALQDPGCSSSLSAKQKKASATSGTDFRKPGFLRLKNLPANSQEVFQPQRYLFSRRKC